MEARDKYLELNVLADTLVRDLLLTLRRLDFADEDRRLVLEDLRELLREFEVDRALLETKR